MKYVYLIIFLLAPAGIMWLCKRYKWLGKIGPILVLYILGIILGNLGLIPGLPECIARPEGLYGIQDILTSAMVPLAIPLMLFGCSFRKSETKNQVLALVTGIFSVICAVVAGYLIFHKAIDASSLVTTSQAAVASGEIAGTGTTAAKIGGMLTGVYTGGTVNLAALQTMLGVGGETYVLLNSYDMVISFLFLTFLISCGIKLFRKFLPYGAPLSPEDASFTVADATSDSSKPKRFSALWWKQAGILIGITIALVGISAGIAIGFNKLVPGEWFMTVFILVLTTLGIAASFNSRLRALKIADDIGMYCIYVFSITVASMADIKAMDFSGSLSILGYLALVIFGSFTLQILLAKIFRIDSDTVIIASTAFICSPPFVPMMAAAMKNRRVVISGLSIGIIGYAIGTYLGFAISKLLPLL